MRLIQIRVVIGFILRAVQLDWLMFGVCGEESAVGGEVVFGLVFAFDMFFSKFFAVGDRRELHFFKYKIIKLVNQQIDAYFKKYAS